MRLPVLIAATLLLPSLFAGAVVTGFRGPSKLTPAMTRQRQTQKSKYFGEAGGTVLLGHYDGRYFPGKPVDDDVRRDSLTHLMRSYLQTFRERNIETWIAHGSLLGWWWNGKILPWDTDLDVQVSGATLTWLANNLNMTMYNFTSVGSDGTEVTRQYLLDINSNYASRLRGDGMNVIDARWIDTHTGLFIDITGLSETNPKNRPGVWSCKNLHKYRTRDLYPLRESEFEGVPALVPYNFDHILTDEYTPQALTKTFYEG